MGLPKTTITFRELADDVIVRSSRGAVALLLDDSTKTTSPITYYRMSEIDADDWTAANAAYIKLAFASGANQVIATRLIKEDSTADYTASVAAIVPTKWDWLAAPTADAAGVTAIVTKIKALRALGYTYKAVVANAGTEPDSEGIVNYTQTGTITSDCLGTATDMTAQAYTVRLAGVFSALPLDRSATGYELGDITSLAVSSTPDDDIDAGKLVIIYNGENYEIGRGVTSLKTTSATAPALFCKIKHVEGADMIAKDIDAIWRSGYRGKVVCDYAHKQSLVGEIIAYYKGITGTVLSADGINTAHIDADAVASWLTAAGVDISGMSEDQIVQAQTDDKVFIASEIKLLDAMEDITLSIVLS